MEQYLHYPIRVKLDSYRGKAPRKMEEANEYNRVAKRLEEYINSKMEFEPEGKPVRFSFIIIAGEIAEDPALVESIGHSINCDSRGVTVYKAATREPF